MKTFALNNAVELLWHLMPGFLSPGDTAVDATVGNGKDTAALCRLVGGEGHVYGFDIQQAALNRAAEVLQAEAPGVPCTLIHGSHGDMLDHISGLVDVVLFNLGYLPGGDKSITTQAESTLAALNASLELLKGGGRIAVVLYPGHEAGAREAEAVKAWASALSQKKYSALFMGFMNQVNNPPQLLIIEKKG